MKRRFRSTFLNAATIASLLLCGATTVLWFTQPHVAVRPFPVHRGQDWDGRTAYGVRDGRMFVGRYWRSHHGSMYDHVASDASVPCWLVVYASAALPAVRAYRRLRASPEYDPYKCPACGYDCRATPDRCPECGRATA